MSKYSKILEAYENNVLMPAILEGSTEDAAKSLQAIIGTLKKGDGDKDMLKMATGIMDYYKKNKSFAPDQAKWIYNTSKALFK